MRPGSHSCTGEGGTTTELRGKHTGCQLLLCAEQNKTGWGEEGQDAGGDWPHPRETLHGEVESGTEPRRGRCTSTPARVAGPETDLACWEPSKDGDVAGASGERQDRC